jgi:hypothetical protein
MSVSSASSNPKRRAFATSPSVRKQSMRKSAVMAVKYGVLVLPHGKPHSGQ